VPPPTPTPAPPASPSPPPAEHVEGGIVGRLFRRRRS
jgi:hypothetical protein